MAIIGISAQAQSYKESGGKKMPIQSRLSGSPDIESGLLKLIEQDWIKCLKGWWPDNLNHYLITKYQVDITARYAGQSIANPFGKASGQLTMNVGQIRESAQAGLGFVVLKTLIAQNAMGHQSMSAWSIPESKMQVEPITGQSGRSGWTITWKGRGWSRSFEDYIQLCRDSFEISMETGLIVAPSVKFHLPANLDEKWDISEYDYTLNALANAWQGAGGQSLLIVEKDFSPTLAGDQLAKQEKLIERWLTEITSVIRNATSEQLTLGIKLFNFVGDHEYQNEILRICLDDSCKPDFLVYANRLFNPNKTFQGVAGVAYGGPDLSDRNLAILARCRPETTQSNVEISGTGDIDSGRTAVEYGLLGCSSVQMHTIFQIPTDIPASAGLSRTRKTLATLVFHPVHGLTGWLLHARRHWGLCNESGLSKWMGLKDLKMQPLEAAD